MKKLYIIVSIFIFTFTTAWSQISTDLTNTVRISYWDSDMEPDYGVEYHYYKTNSQLVFFDNEEISLNNYTWNSDTGRLTDTSFEEYFDYTYLTASEGIFVFSEGSTGTFAIYDASWDLDHDGTPDGEQIDAGILPKYPHKQLGLATSGSSSFWLSNVGVSASDLSLAFSEQQIDVIASGNSPWGIVNAKYVSNSGEIDTLSWDNDWTVDVVILNSVPVTDGGIKDSGSAINQAVMWLGLRTTAANYNDDGLLEIVMSNHNGRKRIGADSDHLEDFNASLFDPPAGEVHLRLSYNSTEAELTSTYSYDGNQYTDLSTSSVAALQSYINRDPIAVELGAESDNVQINAGENTFKEFVVVTTPPPIRPAVAAGPDFSLYLDATGTVWAVGDNDSGQLADGSSDNICSIPKPVMSGVQMIAAGDSHSLFLKTDGSVWASGDNWTGQLGDGTYDNKSTPVQVMTGVQAISAGDTHSLFLKTDGTVWATGANYRGQLGIGEPNLTFYQTADPVQVMAGVKAISAGKGYPDGHSLFLKTDGSVWATGANSDGQLGNGSNQDQYLPVSIMSGVQAISAGEFHSVFLKTDGSAWATGLNANGQLSDGTFISKSSPVQVMTGVKAISAGYALSLFLKTDGKAYASGEYVGGESADGFWQPSATPIFLIQDVSVISAGDSHFLFLKTDGAVWAVGSNKDAMLGDKSYFIATPVQVMTGVKSIAPGATSHSMFLKTDGSAWAVGANHLGYLGDGSRKNRSIPVQVMTAVKAIALGEEHSLFLKMDGSVWATGGNWAGQLGDETFTEKSSPVQVMTGVQAIAAGVEHSLFLKNDGTVWATGYNGEGQLGDGQINYVQAEPVQVISGVKAIAAGDRHSFFLKSNGDLWGTGLNDEGQLGVGTTESQFAPIYIMSGVQALAAPHGGDHSLILKTDGSVWGTGRNSSGQLGDGTLVQKNLWVQIMTGVKAVAQGSHHSLFLKTDNTVWATGSNSTGELGTGDTVNQKLPVQVMSNVQAMGCGEVYSLFLKTDGTAWATGGQNNGILGNGVGLPSLTPVRAFTAALLVPANVSLSELIISSGTLSPAFGSAITSYTTNVINSVESVTVTPTVMDGTATVKVNGATVASGSASGAIPLEVGSNTITVLVSAQDGTTTETYQLVVDKFPIQSISAFTSIANKAYGDAPFTVTAPVATSGLPVTLSVKSGPATISGNTVTITAAGTVVLAANQAGNDNYTAATEMTTSFTVSKATQTIGTFASIANKAFGDASFAVTAPTSTSSLPVTLSVKSGPATISGNTVTITGTGTVMLAANQTGDANYNAATEVTASFSVSKAAQTIGTFASIANKAFGDASFAVTAPTSTSSLPVTLSVKSGSATISGNTVTMNGVGPVVLAANQVGNENYLAADEVTVTFAVLDMRNFAGDFIGNYDAHSPQSLEEAYHDNGQLSVKIAKGGGFSGSLVISGSRVAVRGKFDSEGKASLVIKNQIIGEINMNLWINPLNSSDLKIDASITRRNGSPFDFICYPVAYAGTGGEKNFPLGGKQINSLMASQSTAGIDFGHGFAMIKASNDGTLKFTGRAADGSAITGTTRLVKDAYGDILAPVSFPLSAVKGLLHGVAKIDANPEEGQYHLSSPSEWTWVRLPQAKAKTYKEGFAEKLGVYGQVWSFTKGQSALPEAEGGFTFQVDPDSVLLEEPVELSGTWPTSNKPTWDAAPTKGFTFKVNTATGQISGAAPRTINGKAAKALSYQGLLVRPALDTYDGAPLLGGGYILGTESSGVVELTAP